MWWNREGDEQSLSVLRLTLRFLHRLTPTAVLTCPSHSLSLSSSPQTPWQSDLTALWQMSHDLEICEKKLRLSIKQIHLLLNEMLMPISS